MEIFDVSKKKTTQKIYSFEEVSGSNINLTSEQLHSIVVTGYGDATYNSRRGLLGGLGVGGQIAYHLFNIDSHSSKLGASGVRLLRKAKWHSQHYDPESDYSDSSHMLNHFTDR